MEQTVVDAPTAFAPVKSYLDFTAAEFVQPMDEETCGLFLQLTLDEMEATKAKRSPVNFNFTDLASNGEPEFMTALEKSFVFQVFSKRIQCCAPKTQITLFALLFLLSLCDTPGDAVMWAYTAHRLAQRRGMVSMHTLAEAFPVGFLNEKGRRAAWDAQKRADCPLGNAVDAIMAWA